MHDRSMKMNDDGKADKDYERNDLDDADDEELEDRLVEAARVA